MTEPSVPAPAPAPAPAPGASRCPICGRPAGRATKPFCSRRCADVDLGRWFGERYRVPTAEPPPEPRDAPAGDEDAG